MTSKVRTLKPKHVPMVVIVEVNDDGGDPPTWNLLGDSFEDVKLEVRERLRHLTPEKMKNINRLDLEKHIEEMATREYHDQFESKTLMHDVWQDLEMLIAGGMGSFTVKVFEMSKEKYEKAMAEATDE